MSKILIINFDSQSSVLRSLDIVKSINVQAPTSEVHLLTTKSLMNIGRVTTLFKSVHAIDVSRIQELVSNKMIPDTMALDSFIDDLDFIIEEKWHTVINFSKSELAKQLTSFVSSMSGAIVIGPASGLSAPTIHSDIWTTLVTELRDNYYSSPLSLVDGYSRSIRLENKVIAGDEVLRINPSFTQKTFNAFKTIRSANQQNCRMIGIELKGIKDGSEIPFDNMCSLLNNMLDDASIYPVLLIRPEEEQRVYAREINKRFGNCLVIIEADAIALPSITLNLDAVIAPDSLALATASLTLTPSLEISIGAGGFKSFVSTNGNSFVLRLNPGYGNIENSVLCALRVILGDTKNFTSQYDTLFRVESDKFGSFYQWRGGKLDIAEQLNYEMSRLFVSKFSSNQLCIKEIQDRIPLTAQTLESWAQFQRHDLTDASRDLLGALRSLLRLQKDSKFAKEFVMSLSKLFAYSKTNSITAIPITLFATRLESLEGGNLLDNIKIVERALYQLKDEIQLAVNQIKDTEQVARNLRNTEMVTRAKIQIQTN